MLIPWRATVVAVFVAGLSLFSALAAADLPEYRVIDRFKVPGEDVWGDVLIPAFTPDMPVENLAKALTEIAKKEGFDLVDFYRTEEARKANLSASYNEAHPGVLEAGFLGTVEAGEFLPSIYVYPEFYRPVASAQAPSDPSLPDFKVVERKKLNDALALSVQTSAMNEILRIATHLVKEDCEKHFMVRMFFYEPGQVPAQAPPMHRIEWTKEAGFVQSF